MIDGFLITRNRQAVLTANLESYAALGITTHILDATSAPCDAAHLFCKSHPTVQYHHLPEVSIVDRLSHGLARSGSKYCLLLSDDDHFSPQAVSQCRCFLDDHPDYVAAQGAFWVSEASGPNGFDLEHYCPSLDADDPEQRLRRHATFYGHTAYAVHRRGAFLHSLEVAGRYGDSNGFIELAASFSLVLSGKLRRFPDVYCLRTPNTTEYLQQKYTTHPKLWLEHDPEGYGVCLEEFLAHIEGIMAGLPGGGVQAPFREIFDLYLLATYDAVENIVCRHRYLLFLLEQMGGAQNAFEILRATPRPRREVLTCDMEQSLRQFLRETGPWRLDTGLARFLPPGDLIASQLSGK